MKLGELYDPKFLLNRPRNAMLMKSNKPLHKVQLNRAKSFKHYLAQS